MEWTDSELGADNIYAWAKEQALGMSRRMISDYRTAQKAIPRAVWLACLGWEASHKNRHLGKKVGGADGTRTRDPRRDRPVF